MTEKKLSFTLKTDGTGITGSVDILSPTESQGQTVVPDVNKTLSRGMAILVLVIGGLSAIGFTVSFFYDGLSTMYMLIGCASTMLVSTLFFGIHCCYQIRMARLIADERKMGYGVLKELVGKLPETSQTNMLIAKSCELLEEISGKLPQVEQTRGFMTKSYVLLQQIAQTIQTKK